MHPLKAVREAINFTKVIKMRTTCFLYWYL